MKTAFLELIRLIVAGDVAGVTRRVNAAAELVRMASPVGATRQTSTEYFFPAIGHCLYAGDTALQIAAAAYSLPIVKLLVANGANCRAKNRRAWSRSTMPPMEANGTRAHKPR
jgi:ankyrin repeat protein